MSVKVLLADDDRIFQLMLGGALPKWGYQPILVGNGEEAWQHLRDVDGPSLAILDWVMPLADGLDVCRRVRSSNITRYIYIILLTSKGSSQDVMKGFEAGADDYLSKPVSLTEVRLRLLAGSRVLESEERYRRIAEHASDGIVTWEENHRIHFANSAAGTIFGHSVSELLGMEFSALAPGFERSFESSGLQTPGDIQTDQQSYSKEPVEMIGKHGAGHNILLDVSLSASPRSVHGRILTAMVRDVTERRRLEVQRGQAQKLESIGQLAAGVAHEINTPIQYIGDNIHFVEEGWASLCGLLQDYRRLDTSAVSTQASTEEPVDFAYLEREVPAAIKEALEGVQQVAAIVRAMKEFAYPGGVEMVPADLNHLIETAAVISRNRWKYVADMKMDLDPALPLVPCVAGQVSQVLLNLIVNATDAINDAIRDGLRERGDIGITTRAMEGFVEARVTDSGTGIPLSVRHRVFDPFFTTKEVGKGSGQGLALAYATIVQKHHGSIDFESTLGVGTTFFVRLPIGFLPAGVEDEK